MACRVAGIMAAPAERARSSRSDREPSKRKSQQRRATHLFCARDPMRRSVRALTPGGSTMLRPGPSTTDSITLRTDGQVWGSVVVTVLPAAAASFSVTCIVSREIPSAVASWAVLAGARCSAVNASTRIRLPAPVIDG